MAADHFVFGAMPVADEAAQERKLASKAGSRQKTPPTKRARSAKSSKKKVKSPKNANRGRRPGPKPYPIITFEQALRIGQGIADYGSGHPMKRTTLLEKLVLPNTQSTKGLITASSKYGVTSGGHDAVELRLTDDGMKAVSAGDSPERIRARIKLAITEIEPFKKLYEKFQGRKLPAVEVCETTLRT
jgi:hypothetical protein